MQTDFVNKWATRAQPLETLEKILMATLLLWNAHLKENKKPHENWKEEEKVRIIWLLYETLVPPDCAYKRNRSPPREQHDRTREGKEKGRCDDQESATVTYQERLKLSHLQGRRLRKYDQGLWNHKGSG